MIINNVIDNFSELVTFYEIVLKYSKFMAPPAKIKSKSKTALF